MNKSPMMTIVIIVLLVLILVLLVLFGINALYLNKHQQDQTAEKHRIPKAFNESIIMCKNGHKFMIYKNQIIQILDTRNKPAICKDDTVHVDGE